MDAAVGRRGSMGANGTRDHALAKPQESWRAGSGNSIPMLRQDGVDRRSGRTPIGSLRH